MKIFLLFFVFSDFFLFGCLEFCGFAFSSSISEIWDLSERQSQETASSSSEAPGDLRAEAICPAKELGSEHLDQAPQPSDPPRNDTPKAPDACDVIAKEKSADAVAEDEALTAPSPSPLGAISVFLRVLFFLVSVGDWFDILFDGFR